MKSLQCSLSSQSALFYWLFKSKVETNWRHRVDAIALVGHVVSELSALRREQLKPSLQPEFHTICANNATTTSNLLFGDDLSKQFSMRRRRTPRQNGSWPIQQTIWPKLRLSAQQFLVKQIGGKKHHKSGSRPPFLGKGHRSVGRKKPYHDRNEPEKK